MVEIGGIVVLERCHVHACVATGFREWGGVWDDLGRHTLGGDFV